MYNKLAYQVGETGYQICRKYVTKVYSTNGHVDSVLDRLFKKIFDTYMKIENAI